ncbi:UDP-2,3-diacylglucosamine diphosphatase [Teredinibacter purpureus]|uniref:UDP-2,3-diacylglucosamine diphosphatase n=1 Tax=Teredinibacter purpureus TaxID=2731756 RepID=UPI0005F8063B|nr:UDP-2,3-diacylglucosamine diphosphatase [Teredinibacter purpureus]
MHYFISDTHFCESRPAHTQCFLSWCAATPQRGDTLMLLGDIFEVWVGDDVVTEVSNKTETALKDLVTRGITVYFMAGNRDFLVGKRFAARSGATLLPDPCLWKLPNGEKCLLTHGDIFCTHDKGYRRFRAITRNAFVQWCFRRLPRSLRLNIADSMRMASQKSQANKTSTLLDASERLVDDTFERHPEAGLIIMGHTHRPKIHSSNNLRIRAVLGDWGDDMWIGVASNSTRFELCRKGITDGKLECVQSI